MTLKDALDEIEKNQPLANEEVSEGNYATFSARLGRKKAAKERLNELRREYAKELSNTSMFIICVGSLASEFAQACEAFSGFVNDPEDFYNDLSQRLSSLLTNGRPTMSNVFDVLGRHLEDKMLDLGVVGYPQLIMNTKYAREISSQSELQELIKQAVNEQMGSEIVGVQAAYSTVDRAIKRRHQGSTTLMLLPTQDEALARSLQKDLVRLRPNVFVVGAGKLTKGMKEIAGSRVITKISAENVESVIKSVKNSIRK